ncbi:MAG: ATP-binding cassette domain-containing protein [Verrucomicrobia bacterium]|jgi:phospholipid/cholesterol/gamma-HCH transport system ATP-binding protein|nr:ATP-binding cassette domain-containing protein [Verrucomicrobiota bacterium]
MSETPLVHIDNVVLSFGDKTVLDGVDLKILSGERLVILGQSGSGKSTMLRLILGILKPTSGVVRYRHLQVQKLSRSKLNALRRRIGMVYQYSALISSMTVRQNLALPVEEMGRKSHAEINQLIKANLEAVGMSGTEEKMPSELSGGMRKRVSLARALMMQPELILFDEPSAGLDPVISSVIDELIIGLTDKTKATSVIVTHEMESAFKIATRMAMLYRGKIIEDAAPELFRASKNPVVHQFVTGTAEGPITEVPSHADTAQ